MESVSIRKVYWFTEIPATTSGRDFRCGYLYVLRCFRSALQLHFHWIYFISIINEARNYTHSWSKTYLLLPTAVQAILS